MAEQEKEMYSGKVDYDIIADVKRAISIPVIGNGDIVDAQTAAVMLEKQTAMHL